MKWSIRGLQMQSFKWATIVPVGVTSTTGDGVEQRRIEIRRVRDAPRLDGGVLIT